MVNSLTKIINHVLVRIIAFVSLCYNGLIKSFILRVAVWVSRAIERSDFAGL